MYKPYKPYLIRTPEFSPTSGGIRVMYGLYGWLLAKGQLAYLNTRIDTPSIGIYPEIYAGNEMDSQKVIRYILQTPGVMGTTINGVFQRGPTVNEYKNDPQYMNDEFYVFSKIYDTFGVNDDHILFLPIINLHLFRDLKKKRTKTCYIVGKGTNKNKHPEDAIELTRELASDQAQLAVLLNECQLLYGYDHLTAMYDIARLCGCPVTYLGDATRDELKDYEPGLDGIDFGDGTMWTSDAFRFNYENMVTDFSMKLDRMIDRTQSD